MAAAKAYDVPKPEFVPFNPEPIFHKTKLCKFYEKGACMRGSRCVFAHGRKELSTKPDFACTSMCPRLIRTGSCAGAGRTCLFAHTLGQLRPRVGARAPTAMTRNDIVGRQLQQVQAPTAITRKSNVGRQLEQVQAKLFRTQQELKFLEGELLRQQLQQAHEDADCSKASDIRKGPWSRQTTAESLASQSAAFSSRQGSMNFDGDSDDDDEDLGEEDLRGLDDAEEDLSEEDLRGLDDAEEDKEYDLSSPAVATTSAGSLLPPPPGMVVKNTFLELDGAARTRTLRQVTSSPALLGCEHRPSGPVRLQPRFLHLGVHD